MDSMITNAGIDSDDFTNGNSCEYHKVIMLL